MKTTLLFMILLTGFIFVSTVVKANKRNAECTPGRDSDTCGPDMRCMKRPNNKQYYCACKPGYLTKGASCKDVDECSDKRFRLKCKSLGGKCKNTRGSFECLCRQGFEMHPLEHICKDRDECEELEICHERATCHNTRGSYRCTCNKGFAGDGVECVEDIAYKHEKDKKLIIMIGGAAGGGVLFIIALIAFCCCASKRKEEEKGEIIEKMESTLSEYGNEWQSSEDSESD